MHDMFIGLGLFCVFKISETVATYLLRHFCKTQ